MSYAALRSDVKKRKSILHFLGILFLRVLRVGVFTSELPFDKQLLIFLARYRPSFPLLRVFVFQNMCFVLFFLIMLQDY